MEVTVLKNILKGVKTGGTYLRFFIAHNHSKDTWRLWNYSDHVSIGTGEFRRLSKFNVKQQAQFKKLGYIVTGTKV